MCTPVDHRKIRRSDFQQWRIIFFEIRPIFRKRGEIEEVDGGVWSKRFRLGGEKSILG